ncbi:hypothetical protein AMTRI_Chr02g217820 [Amborella trichopoda]
MTLLFWNVRGLGNSKARQALMDLPKIFFGDLPISFLKSIRYSIDVIQNSRSISKSNLWILFHASHTYAKRRELWL